jgi:hypothetical protein
LQNIDGAKEFKLIETIVAQAPDTSYKRDSTDNYQRQKYLFFNNRLKSHIEWGFQLVNFLKELPESTCVVDTANCQPIKVRTSKVKDVWTSLLAST